MYRPIAPALRVALGFACVSLSGCVTLQAYEKDWFATEHVHVVVMEQHCKDAEQSAGSGVQNADLVLSRVDGIGYFVATRTAWEVRGRQLAAELDADISVIRPCDGDTLGLQQAQIEVWRRRGYSPVVHEETPPERGTLAAPALTSYGSRLQDIFDCLEQAREAVSPPSVENKTRPGSVDATEFFSWDPHFPGYAKVDRYFRPTQLDGPTLTMILSDRSRADREAGWYHALSSRSRGHYAEQYLACLLGRGYSWEE